MRFPKLKTGAIAQYPFTTHLAASHAVLRFLDGSVQVIPNHLQTKRSWRVYLHQLDDAEMAELESFIRQLQGARNTFTFTDPDSGQEYHGCYLRRSEYALHYEGPHRNQVMLEIAQR